MNRNKMRKILTEIIDWIYLPDPWRIPGYNRKWAKKVWRYLDARDFEEEES